MIHILLLKSTFLTILLIIVENSNMIHIKRMREYDRQKKRE